MLFSNFEDIFGIFKKDQNQKKRKQQPIITNPQISPDVCYAAPKMSSSSQEVHYDRVESKKVNNISFPAHVPINEEQNKKNNVAEKQEKIRPSSSSVSKNEKDLENFLKFTSSSNVSKPMKKTRKSLNFVFMFATLFSSPN